MKPFWTKKKMIISLIIFFLLAGLGVFIYFLVPKPDDSILKKGEMKKYRMNSYSCVEVQSANQTHCGQLETNITLYVYEAN